MVKASKGIRVKTRRTLRVRPRDRGMPPITRTLREFKVGEKTAIKIDGRVAGGMPHARYQGQTGVVVGKQGRAFLVEIVQGKKTKTILATAEHLKRA
jgi:large subunit ribosomal protein L21e